MSASTGVERAIAGLRAGRVVRIEPGATVLAVETATTAMLELSDPDRSASLLLSGQRAAMLGLGNSKNAADPARPVLVSRSEWLDRDTAIALADASDDMARAPLGPLRPLPLPDDRSADAALKLARVAGLLPALWWLNAAVEGTTVQSDEVLDARAEAVILARAKLPIEGIEEAQIVSFRDRSTGEDHSALVIGAFGGKPPLVRLHSECLTGDVFGSLKCDCGPQLREALRLIAAQGGGVLLYLRQEGRGIGLPNKIRAYQLQDRGLDTVDANRRLGFVDDARDYGIAAAMLRALGIEAVRLLTNNPAKLEGLQRGGIEVVERVAHHMPANPHNADYIATKRDRSGHLI